MDGQSAMTLENRLAGRVARFADRREDWSVFGFETALDPRYARAQRRYLGASGSTDPADLRGSIPATAFTMSIQTMPAGNRIPVHCHETEEVFFILDGPIAPESNRIRVPSDGTPAPQCRCRAQSFRRPTRWR